MKLYVNRMGGIVAGVILGALLMVQVQAFAEPAMADKQAMQEKWKEKMAAIHEKLGLTEEQEGQLKAHKEKHRSEMKALKEQVKVKKDEIRQELQGADFNEAKVRQLHAELKSLKNQKEDQRLNGILEVRAILTAEQFNQFMALKEEWKKKKWHHGDKGKKGNIMMPKDENPEGSDSE